MTMVWHWVGGLGSRGHSCSDDAGECSSVVARVVDDDDLGAVIVSRETFWCWWALRTWGVGLVISVGIGAGMAYLLTAGPQTGYRWVGCQIELIADDPWPRHSPWC